MKYDFIGIREQLINGIKNPMLTIVGTLEKKDCKFLVLADGKKIDYDIDIVNSNNDFALFAKIDNNVRYVEVYIIDGKNKYMISKLKNSTVRKVLRNLKHIIVNFFYKLWMYIKYFCYTFYKGVRLAWREHHFLIPPALWPKYFKDIVNKIKYPVGKVPYYNAFIPEEYNKWLEENKEEEEIVDFKYNPLISIVIPVYNIEEDLLLDCIESILNQIYTNFEICLADDCSPKKETRDALKKLEKRDPRIKVVYRKENGHISKATNSAIEISNGEFVAFMDDDDVLTPNALYEIVKALNENPKLDMIYTDEDKMEMNGTLCEPTLKPDYSPDTLFGGNYICHFSVFRKSLFDKVGLLKTEFNGAQDFDFVLRFSEITKNIYHIPKILYHWRKVPGSTAVTVENKDYAIENGKSAVEEALKRRGLKGKVYTPIKTTHYVVEYDIIGNPLITIIIPTKDDYKTLDKCLKSIYEKTTYNNYEIIVIDNQSVEKNTFELLKKYKSEHNNFRVMKANYSFNFSKMNNEAVKEANGDYIVLLNNDTEVITNNWLELMLGYAQQKHIGAVGVKLLYPDGTIQHGGVILGLGDVAAHAYVGLEGDSLGTYGRLLIPYNYSAVTAACLMISKKKYEKVNGLEEELEVAFNDVDFCLKLLDKGYYNIFLPQVKLYHYESKTRGLDTTSIKYRKFLREREYMNNKWKEKICNDKFYNPNYSLIKDFYLPKKVKKDEKASR